MDCWYLLYCPKGKENNERLIRALEVFRVEVYQPMTSTFRSRRDRPGKFKLKRIALFPNYLFIRFDYTELAFSRIVSLEGVSGFVRSSNRIATLSNQAIADLKQSLASSESKKLYPGNGEDAISHLIWSEPKESERLKLLLSILT
ncbi:transcription termination/antitermination NusG family protein [Vibrio cyclitrophicus]